MYQTGKRLEVSQQTRPSSLMKEVLVGGENSPAKPRMIADPEHHDLSTRDLPSEFREPSRV